jgi:hypothetical protein
MTDSPSPSSSPSLTHLVSLTSGGLAFLPPNIYKTDFTFIVGERRHMCPAIVADFLSPLLCRIRQTDSSFDEYKLDIEDDADEFLTFLSLGRGSKIAITDTNRSFYLRICEVLENTELQSHFMTVSEEELTINTIFSQLRLLLNGKMDCSQAITFAASHFYELMKLDLKLIESDIELFDEILSSESLQLRDEDSLFDFLVNLISKDSQYFSLLEFIQFEYLSTTQIVQFVSLTSNLFDCFTFSIWVRVCNRLILPVSPNSLNCRIICDKSATLTIPYCGTPFSGIIHRLTTDSGGNVCDSGILSVTVSHTNPNIHKREVNGGAAKFVFDLDSRVGWYDANQNPTWLQVDFQTRKIQLTAYSINFGECGNTGRCPQWVLEGSHDGKSWTTIDDRASESKERKSFDVETFHCQSGISDTFQYLRLFKKGNCWGNYHQLGLAALEFFGTLTAHSST